MRKTKWILSYLLVYLSIFFITGVLWILGNFGEISVSQIVFLLMVPMEGADSSIIWKFVYDCLLLPFIYCCFLFFFIYILIKIKNRISIIFDKHILKLSFVICIISFIYSGHSIGLFSYLQSLLRNSTLFEDYYIDPSEVEFDFPEQKRNLIYIFMESMEISYYSEELGGVEESNLIPELYEIAEENLTFNNNGGFYVPEGTGWTVGAMVAQTSGLPLLIPIDGNSYGSFRSFLPGATSIGDILSEAGYRQKLLIGSDASFGGRREYFTQHGNYDIVDYIAAKEKQYIDENYYVWWGYEDSKLYEFAKEEVKELAKGSEPFNLTMLTVDTHFFDGYLCDECEQVYESQYENVIACASRQLYNFLTWIKQQDFYENTTIVIAGDHLTMDNDFFASIDSNYVRKGYYVFINSAAEYQGNDREVSSFDFFPTTLASMGIKFNEDRLGLGTNLFSETPTLVEELGWEELNEQLRMTSKLYNNEILYDKDK